MADFFDDIPDDVLDSDDGFMDPNDIVAEVRSEENFETADIKQDIMLSYITQNPDIWIKSAPILKPSYFEPEYRPVIKFISDYYKKHSRLPPKNLILLDTNVAISPVDEEEAGREDTVEYVLEQVEKFCQHGAVEAAMYSALDIMDGSNGRKMTRSQAMSIRERFEDASKVSMKRNLGIDVHADVQKYLELDKKFGAIPTGIGFLDKAFGGGVAQPSFNVVSAASGQGKSIFLQNIAFNYALGGRNVIFYTLELEYPTIVKRFSAMMTNTDIALVTQDIHSIAHQMKQMKRSQGAIMAMKFPMNTTILEIEAHYRDISLETDLQFDVVCIDYIDVMAPADTGIERGNIHIKDKDISEDMNNFFHANHIIGWTASQQTKTAVEEKELKSSNVSGGRSKVDTADNLIMLRRNEEERETERMWAIIRKARSSNAVNSKVPLRWNSKTQRMGDGDDELFIKENPHIFGEQSKKLREKDQGYSDNITKDAIAQEQGLPEKEKAEEPKSKRVHEAVKTRDNLRKRLNVGKKDE